MLFPTAVLLLPVVIPVQLFIFILTKAVEDNLYDEKNIIFLLTHLAMIAIYNR